MLRTRQLSNVIEARMEKLRVEPGRAPVGISLCAHAYVLCFIKVIARMKYSGAACGTLTEKRAICHMMYVAKLWEN